MNIKKSGEIAEGEQARGRGTFLIPSEALESVDGICTPQCRRNEWYLVGSPTYYSDSRLVKEHGVLFRDSEDFPILWDGTIGF